MKYNQNIVFFWALNQRVIGHGQHLTYIHIFLENIDSHSYDSKQTFINIFITKNITWLISTRKRTQPTKPELVTGTRNRNNPCFWIRIYWTLRGLSGKGSRKKRTHIFYDVWTLKFLPKPSLTLTSKKKFQHQTFNGKSHPFA